MSDFIDNFINLAPLYLKGLTGSLWLRALLRKRACFREDQKPNLVPNSGKSQSLCKPVLFPQGSARLELRGQGPCWGRDALHPWRPAGRRHSLASRVCDSWRMKAPVIRNGLLTNFISSHNQQYPSTHPKHPSALG